MRLLALTDDSLLYILGRLKFDQLLPLRLVCQRFLHLIENGSLRTIKCISMEMIQSLNDPITSTQMKVAIGKYHSNCLWRLIIDSKVPEDAVLRLLQSLSNVQHFTFDYNKNNYFSTQYSHWLLIGVIGQNISFVPRICEYLQSNLANSLVSLQLLVIADNRKDLQHLSTAINNLRQLKHLHLQFECGLVYIPDEMPILHQLQSFILTNYNYWHLNILTLLSLLGPDLRCLRLRNVNIKPESICEWFNSSSILGKLTDFGIGIIETPEIGDRSGAKMQPVFSCISKHMHSLVALHIYQHKFEDEVCD